MSELTGTAFMAARDGSALRENAMRIALQHLGGTGVPASDLVKSAKVIEAYLRGEPA